MTTYIMIILLRSVGVQILMVLEMIMDTVHFMLLFLLITLGFGVAMASIFHDLPEYEDVYVSSL
jgi:hypothetical protein